MRIVEHVEGVVLLVIVSQWRVRWLVLVVYFHMVDGLVVEGLVVLIMVSIWKVK